MEITNKKKLIKNSLLMVGSLIICIVIAMFTIIPQTYDVKQGEVSSQTITANKDIVDEITTKSLIEEEQAKVGAVYSKNEETNNQILKKIEEDLVSFYSARAYVQKIFDEGEQTKFADSEAAIAKVQEANAKLANDSEKSAVPPLYIVQQYDPKTMDATRLFSRTALEPLNQIFPQYIYTTDFSTILSMSQVDLDNLNSIFFSMVKDAISKDIYAEDVESVKSTILQNISEQSNLTNQEVYILNKMLNNAIVANMTFDEEETQNKRKSIADSFIPVEYKQGQNIVVKGEKVTAAQYQILKSLGMLQAEVTSINPYVAVGIYIFLVFALYILFLLRFNFKLFMTTKKVATLSILTVFAFACTCLSQLVSLNIYPITLFVILGAILLSPKNAIIYSMFLSLLLISITVHGHEMISKESLVTLLIMIFGSFFTVYVLKDMKFRSTLIFAGATSSIPAVIIMYISFLHNFITLKQFGSSAIIMVASGMMCGIISIGVLPLIENAFKLTTPSKLLELSAPNNHLLKRLIMEAPGTYNHSILVANLAEAACNAVGGFSLLARVGAYFHDIGKINKPMFYKENQRNSVNLHDNLVPIQSAHIIIDHVTDGVKLLKAEKIPQEIIDICISHHGDSLVAYFYAEALKKDANVNIEDYRYKGAPPSTKEGAIVMLADSVEAAVRSIESSDKKDIEKMVRKIVKGKYDDGQLDFAPLNRRDLEDIIQAFMNIFDGIYHDRVKYPELTIHGVEDEDNVI